MNSLNLHGDVELEWDHDILVIKPSGPFNLDGVIRALAKIRSAAETEAQLPWRRLEILDDNAIGPPEVMDCVRKNYEWSLTHGCIAIALVIGNQVQKDQLSQQSSKVIRSFDDEASARAWLHQQKPAS